MSDTSKIITKEERIVIEQEITKKKNTVNEIYQEINYMNGEEDYPDFDPPMDRFDVLQEQLGELTTDIHHLEERIYASDYNVFKSDFISIYENDMMDYESGVMLSDVDNDITTDIFNRNGMAKTISDKLCDANVRGPFNIGILGKWGEGKSTFLKYIDKNIEQHVNAKNINIIRYDASTYSEQEQIWANLATALFETYENEEKFAKIKFYFCKAIKNKKTIFEKGILNLVIILILLALTWGSQCAFSYETWLSTFVGLGCGISGIVILISKVIMPMFNGLVSSSISLTNKIIGAMKLPDYVESLGTRAKIEKDIGLLLDAWIPHKNQKIIIFVDELDRCTEKGVAEFFQSIHLLLHIEKLHFVFAIDSNHLKKALQKVAGVSDNKIDDYVNEYLEKYVSIIVPLQKSMKYSKYVDYLLDKIVLSDVKHCFTVPEKEIIKQCIDNISKDVLTPRKVKKLLNILILIKEYCTKNSAQPIDFGKLSIWFIFSSLYKKQAELILSLYDLNRQYTPLNELMSSSKKESFAPEEKTLFNMMKDFPMHDIIVYDEISTYFLMNIFDKKNQQKDN